MSIVPLPLSPGAEARALLRHLLEHGVIAGRDSTGRSIVQLAVGDWVLEKLATLGAAAGELEDQGGERLDADHEEEWLPVVLVDVVPAKIIRRGASPHGAARSR